jgi:adenylosuccinate synthase
MPLDIIVGMQWGDEGKGRITDLLATNSHIVARFGGGDNAGHTVTVGKQICKLHLIPSGILHTHTLCLLGNGMVINPKKLVDEIGQLRASKIEVTPERLLISSAAHIITPAHIALDHAKEKHVTKLGTTLRGIGPAYTDKTARSGIRAGAMRDPERFVELVRTQLQQTGEQLQALFHVEPPDAEPAARDYGELAAFLRPYIKDTTAIVDAALRDGKTVLAEGAQGTLLDLDHGTYPFVTSSHPTTAGALLGLGVGPSHIRRVIGVAKAFQTRVGEGPFPSELAGEVADHLRGTGDNPWDEFGTTTGRPRRCGWLDGVLLQYAARINGISELAITKLDILSGLQSLNIAVAYHFNEERIERPPDLSDLVNVHPIYTEMSGWQEPLMDIEDWEKLPEDSQRYIEFIEGLSGVPAKLLSVGPERHQIIRRNT